MNRRTKIISIVLAIIFMILLTACGEKVEVTIDDGGTTTVVEVKLPRTVEKIIEDAGINLQEKDQTEPSLETKLTEAKEIAILRNQTIQLTIDGESRDIEMLGGTVDDLLKKENITLKPDQNVSPAKDVYLKDGMEVSVFYRYSIAFNYDGKHDVKDVEASNVEDAIKNAGIVLGADDIVEPGRTENIESGMEITIKRVKTETITEKETIEYEVSYEYDSSISKGVEQTSVAGETGEKEVTYKIKYVDGEEESREIENEKIIKEPVTAVVIVGTYEAPAQTTSQSNSSGRTIVSQETFLDCDGSGHGYTMVYYSDGSEEVIEF